jgi:hypothetical protein
MEPAPEGLFKGGTTQHDLAPDSIDRRDTDQL